MLWITKVFLKRPFGLKNFVVFKMIVDVSILEWLHAWRPELLMWLWQCGPEKGEIQKWVEPFLELAGFGNIIATTSLLAP